MNKNSIKIYFKCGFLRSSTDLTLNYFYVEDFSHQRLKQVVGITPDKISGILVGPRTVVELFDDNELFSLKTAIVNPSFCKAKFFNITCPDTYLNVPSGGFRSFRLWNYDYYINKTQNIKLCNNDSECGQNEHCLCPNGYKQPAWCREEGRRCLPKSRYLQSNLPRVDKYDVIDTKCLDCRMTRRFMPFNDIKTEAAHCDFNLKTLYPPIQRRPPYVEGFDVVEGFDSSARTDVIIIVVVILILVGWYWYTKKGAASFVPDI